MPDADDLTPEQVAQVLHAIEMLRAWIPLERQPIGGLALSLIWFVVHTIVFALAGLAYWKRPFDRPLRAYFALLRFG